MRTLTMLLMLALSIALSGCNATGELENQAYVVALGLDRLSDGKLEFTAHVPSIGSGNGKSEMNGSSGDAFLVFSANGDCFADALDALQWATPRKLNLSHIEMLVVSEALAREPDFDKLIDLLTETPNLYATARFIVCEDTARDFIEAQEVTIGTRLSTDIHAMLDHYISQGYIPESSLAEMYYASASIYSDPLAIYSHMTPGDEDRTAFQSIKPPQIVEVSSPARQRYEGAALFRTGRMVGTIDMWQTRLAGLIKGRVRSLPMTIGDTSYLLTSEGPAQRTVALDGGACLMLKVELTTLENIGEDVKSQLEAELGSEMEMLIEKCQGMKVDPFGFAEAAAVRFVTVDKWLDYDWRERYAAASVQIEVHIQ